MAKIPIELREDMANDPFYLHCCITGRRDEKIEWHHNLIFAGKQVQEKWCILPLVKSIHDKIENYKDECNRIMLNRATDDQLRKYSKVINYLELKQRLNNGNDN